MGLFGGTVTYVTSVVYNLAGDINNRPNYLKSLVVRDQIYDTGDISKSINDGYIHGPGLKLRAFGRWSRTNEYYSAMGYPLGSLASPNSLNVPDLTDQISIQEGTDVYVQNADLNFGDISWWCDQWMLTNHPDEFETAWNSDLDEATGEAVIRDASGNELYRFTPVDFDPKSKYIYAAFNRTSQVHHDAIPGDDTVDPPIPETPAWDEWVYGTIEVFLYKIGSGNAVLDAMVMPDVDGGYFFPIIPIRIDNKFIGPDKDVWAPTDLPEGATDDEVEAAYKAKKAANPVDSLGSNFDDLYPLVKRAMKKAIGAKFDKVVDNLAQNKSLSDIDYAYAVFGVCLNTKENAAKLYLWRFFEKVLATQGTQDMTQWTPMLEEFQAKKAIWQAWFDGGQVGVEPERPVFPELITEYVNVYASGPSAINYDVIINWNGMAHNSGTGLAKTDAVAGDIWWEVDADLEYNMVYYHGSESTVVPKKAEQVTLYFQETENSWQAITIWDLVHRNFVYNGKTVETRAKQAILSLDDDGNPIAYEESAFIVPLHYDTFRDMPLVKSTQMSTACCYLVLNCYKVVKKKWYQTVLFQVFLIVVIIAISFVFPPFGATSGGILGSNAAVGMSIGLTGATAIIIGGIINAIAAMVVAKLVGVVSTTVLGDKWGAIIGAIATFAAFSVGSSLANGGSLSTSFATMGRADNILKLTQAVGQGYQGYVKASIQGMQDELKAYGQTVEEQMQAVQDAYAANIGSDRALIDPMSFVNRDTYIPETSDAFLSRTLMLGSDVIEFTHSLIHDFTSLTLSSDLPR